MSLDSLYHAAAKVLSKYIGPEERDTVFGKFAPLLPARKCMEYRKEYTINKGSQRLVVISKVLRSLMLTEASPQPEIDQVRLTNQNAVLRWLDSHIKDDIHKQWLTKRLFGHKPDLRSFHELLSEATDATTLVHILKKDHNCTYPLEILHQKTKNIMERQHNSVAAYKYAVAFYGGNPDELTLVPDTVEHFIAIAFRPSKETLYFLWSMGIECFCLFVYFKHLIRAIEFKLAYQTFKARINRYLAAETQGHFTHTFLAPLIAPPSDIQSHITSPFELPLIAPSVDCSQIINL